MTEDVTMNVVLTKLVNLDLAGKTINGNVTMTSDATGTIDIKAGTITGDLTVDAKNATVNNYATVDGTVTINDISSGTWNELVTGNILVFNAEGKTLNIKEGIKVKALTIKKNATVITPTQINDVVVDKEVTVIVKANVDVSDDDAVTVIGTDSSDSVTLDPIKQEEPDPTKTKVSNKEELETALTNTEVEEITIEGTIGSEKEYTVYNVLRDSVIIKGEENAKVFGTFIVKADGVMIDSLAIQNKGDLTGENTTNRGGIYVFANDVTLTNNTITNGLGENDGLSNAIQIMSPTKDNPLSNYVIADNELIGHNNEVPNWSSSGIVIAQGYNPESIGGAKAETITASAENYQNLLNNNTFTNNKIDLTHQDWSKSGDDVVLYPAPADAAKTAFLAAATSYNPESEVYEYSFDGTDLTIGFDFVNLNEGEIAQAVMGAAEDFLNAVFDADKGNANEVVINMNDQEISLTSEIKIENITALAGAVFNITPNEEDIIEFNELYAAVEKFVVANGNDDTVTADFTMTVTNQEDITFTLDNLKATFKNVTEAGDEG